MSKIGLLCAAAFALALLSGAAMAQVVNLASTLSPKTCSKCAGAR